MNRTGPTSSDYARWAANRVAERKASTRRDRLDPARIAARAADHRAKAEAHLHFVAVREQLPEEFRDLGVDHQALAEREFLLAYEEEN